MKRLSILLAIFLTFHSALSTADQLTIYAYPAPFLINWMNPSSLAVSTLLNSLYHDKKLVAQHAIGHMNFDLNCKPSELLPEGSRVVAGQTSSDNSSENMILNQGYGLGAIITPTPGEWETRKDIEKDLDVRFRRGSVSFIQFEISPKTCARVSEYLKEYQEKNLDQIYGGLQSRPRYEEGAGCSAFTVSVMEVAGVMLKEFYLKWQHNILIPNQLIGGPITGNTVQIKDVIKSLKWGTPDNSYDLIFWDPYRVHRWIQAKARQGNYNPIYIKKSPGLQIDATKIPTPTESFWLK